MAVKLDGKLFTGVTYNQGAFTGDRGHLFIKGIQQCSHSLSLQARNRIWQKLFTIAKLQETISNGSICQACAKKVTNLIQEKGEAK
jgi:bacterioferritin-associated ferredoxin